MKTYKIEYSIGKRFETDYVNAYDSIKAVKRLMDKARVRGRPVYLSVVKVTLI